MDFKTRIRTITNMLIDVSSTDRAIIEERLLIYLEYTKHVEISDKDLFINLIIKTKELLDELGNGGD